MEEFDSVPIACAQYHYTAHCYQLIHDVCCTIIKYKGVDIHVKNAGPFHLTCEQYSRTMYRSIEVGTSLPPRYTQRPAPRRPSTKRAVYTPTHGGLARKKRKIARTQKGRKHVLGVHRLFRTDTGNHRAHRNVQGTLPCGLWCMPRRSASMSICKAYATERRWPSLADAHTCA